MPSVEERAWGYLYSVDVPLWCPFLVLLGPTLFLWWRDRRRSRAGHCRRCDYDLTGNTSGVCPECGTEVVKRVGRVGHRL